MMFGPSYMSFISENLRSFTMSTTSLSSNLRRIANIALAGIVYYIIVFIALHILRPDVNPISQFTSDYSFGPFRILMITAYFSMSLGSLALLIGLHQGIAQQARSLFGLIFLGVWVVGLLIAGVFPLDPNETQPTIAGTIAQVSAPLHVLSLAIGAILLSRSFKQDKNWRSFYSTSLTLSVIMLVLFAAVGIASARGLEFAGLGQRLFIAAALTWLSLTSARLRSIAPRLNMLVGRNAG
jgi:hypothetical protein